MPKKTAITRPGNKPKTKPKSMATTKVKAKAAPAKETPAVTATSMALTPQQTYEAVQRLVAEKQISKSAAMKEIATETGRTPGAVSQTYYVFARKHGGGTVKKRAGKPKKAAAAKAPAVTAAATVSKAQQTFDAVEKLVAETKISKADAFKQIAKETNRTANTISVTYYTFSRKQRGGAPKATAAGRSGPRAGGKSGSIASAITQIEQALKALGQAVKDQSAELARLKAESAWAERVRMAVGKG